MPTRQRLLPGKGLASSLVRVATIVSLVGVVPPWLASAAGAELAVQQAPAGQEEFVPVSELPPEDRMPAAPLLIAAYVFVWLVLLGYLWLIWQRLSRVERELVDLARAADSRRE